MATTRARRNTHIPDDLLRDIQVQKQRASDVSAFLKRWSEASGRFIRATEELQLSATLLISLLSENTNLFVPPPPTTPSPSTSPSSLPVSPAARLAAETITSRHPHSPASVGWTSSSQPSGASPPSPSTSPSAPSSTSPSAPSSSLSSSSSSPSGGGLSPRARDGSFSSGGSSGSISGGGGGSGIEEPDPEKILGDLLERFASVSRVALAPLPGLVDPFVLFAKDIQNSLCTSLALIEDGERAFAKIHHSLDKAEKKVKECAQKGASSYQKLIELEADRDQLSDTVKTTGEVILASSDITINQVSFHLAEALSQFLTGVDDLAGQVGGAFADNSTGVYCRRVAQVSSDELLRQKTKAVLAQNALRDPRKPLKLLKTLQRESRRGAQWSKMKQTQTTIQRAQPRLGGQIGGARSSPVQMGARLTVPDGHSRLSDGNTSSSSSSSSGGGGGGGGVSSELVVDSDDDEDDEDNNVEEEDDEDEEWYMASETAGDGSSSSMDGGGGGGKEDREDQIVREGCWSFEVEKVCRRKTKRKTLVLDAAARSVALYDVTKQTTRVLMASRLMAIRRSNVNPRKIKLFWQSRATPERFLFYTKERVERFHEAYWALRGSCVGLTHKPLTIFVGTWNMGNAPAPDELTPWLPAEPDCDVYMISVQECEYSPRGGQSNEDDWFNQVVQHFGDRYYRLVGLSLLHIRSLVLIKREHYGFVSHLKRTTVATGIANVIGNKGGIGIYFAIYGTRLCFIGAHLAAHQERLSDRNQNYRDIMKGLGTLVPDEWELTTMPHHLFFTGDLNYRIDLPRDEVIHHIDNHAWLALLKADQLSHQMFKAAAFPGFREGALQFTPTYRYNRGDRTWSVEKMRVPSWCDRVLWKSLPGCPIEQLSYDCCNAITTSDHSPAYATFRVQVPLPVPKIPTPVPEPPRQSCLRFYSFRAQLHPKGSGRAEPYIYIAGDFLDAAVSSSPMTGTLTPNWNPDGIPSLIPIICDLDFLRRQHLFVTVRDKSGDPFGQCALSLAELCASPNPGVPVSMTSPIWRFGLITGDVTCSLALLELGGGGTGSDVLKEGYLLKQGELVRNWKRRWFVLKKSGKLEYYGNETDPKPINSITITGRAVKLDTDSGKINCISIEIPKRTFKICADNPGARNEWLGALLEFGALSQYSPNTATADRMSARGSNRADT